MRAIRTINPAARLVHTEDGGAVFATPQLEFLRLEREHRRWLGSDLLCGRVGRHHPLYSFLLEHGLAENEVLWFADNPCPPSILSLNYYVTSDRFLYHRLELYLPSYAGGEWERTLGGLRGCRSPSAGHQRRRAILTDAWKRYGIPVAITEAHLGCDPEEQIRWLAEIWQQAESARANGVDVRAVTVWALIGSYNWCHLCTQDTDAYEAGVFNLVEGGPVKTPLASFVSDLGHGIKPDNSVSRQDGWWHDLSRFAVPVPLE